MYYTGKMLTHILSRFCICFTKDLQNVFLSFDGIRLGFILRKGAFNNSILLLVDLDFYRMTNRVLSYSYTLSFYQI